MATDAIDIEPGLSEVDLHAAPAGLRMKLPSLDEVVHLETPAYLFDADVVARRYRALRQALQTQLIVSFKANSSIDLLSRTAASFVDGIELASIGELSSVVGRTVAQKYVNNPAMPDEFMRAAAVSGCTFIVDSVQQAKRLAGLPVGKRPFRAILRINAHSMLHDQAHVQDHFGMDETDLLHAERVLAVAGWDVFGVHVFAGSNSFRQCGGALIRALSQKLSQWEARIGRRMQFVNLGGGFAEDWEEHPEAMVDYRRALGAFPAGYTLAHESGRGIFSRAGVFITRVVSTKVLGERAIAVCDGGIGQNFLLASTETLVPRLKSAHVVPASPEGLPNTRSVGEIRVVGSSCSRQDVIGRIPVDSCVPSVGDYCVFENCGAYNSTYTVSNFLSLPAAVSYMRASGHDDGTTEG
jgi:diaminopimelate decarboxylase